MLYLGFHFNFFLANCAFPFKEFTSDNQMLQFIVNSDLEAFSKVPDFKKLVSPTFEKFLNNSLFNKMMKNDDVMRFLNSPTFQKLSVNNSFRKLFTSTEFDKFKNKIKGLMNKHETIFKLKKGENPSILLFL